MKGGYYAARTRLQKLREDLTTQFIDEGLTEKDAAKRVADEFIQENVPSRGGARGLYVSPAAVTLLGLERTLPLASREWRSASQLVVQHEVKGSVRSVGAKLTALRGELVDDVAGTGISKQEATEFVDQNLLGIRRTGCGGQEALFASPAALRMLASVVDPLICEEMPTLEVVPPIHTHGCFDGSLCYYCLKRWASVPGCPVCNAREMKQIQAARAELRRARK